MIPNTLWHCCRWFHLYGNHLVYYAGAFEQVNMARPRGVIHLSPETRVFIDAAHDGLVFELDSQGVSPKVAAAGVAVTRKAAPGAAAGSSPAPSLTSRLTIQAGSVTMSAAQAGGVDGTSGLMSPSRLTQVLDEGDTAPSYTAQAPHTSTGWPATPRTTAADATPAAPLPPGKTFHLQVPTRPAERPFNFRAASTHERDGWAHALGRACRPGALYRTCQFCWANCDVAASGDRVVRVPRHNIWLCRSCTHRVELMWWGPQQVRQGYLHLNSGGRKLWDCRWMVCIRRPPTATEEANLHVVYYDAEADVGHRPARGCIHLYAGHDDRDSSLHVSVSRVEARHPEPAADLPLPRPSFINRNSATLLSSPPARLDLGAAPVEREKAVITVYRLVVRWSGLRRGDGYQQDEAVVGHHVVHHRWSECTRFHSILTKELKGHGLPPPPTLQLPRKMQSTQVCTRFVRQCCHELHMLF
jgi:hypothetical protein